MRNLLVKLLGGRPMHLDEHAFTDCHTGFPVYRCTDRLGRKWLANGKWSMFRVSRGQDA